MNRIFNHKPFLEAEIRSMVKDFEEEPNKQCDLNQLVDGTYEKLKNIKDKQIDFIHNYCENDLVPLEQKIDRIETKMQNLLSIEQTKEDERKVKIDQFITKQNEGLAQFLQNMERRINEIDSSYEQAREQIHQKYNKKIYEK